MEKLTNEIKDKIVDIINSARGMNIGTGLQIYFEEEVNRILPSGYTYNFNFNMSGGMFHTITGNGENYNF